MGRLRWLQLLPGLLGLILLIPPAWTEESAPAPQVAPETTLTHELDVRREKFRGKADPERLKAIDASIQQVAASGLAEKALKPGAAAPNFQLPNAVGTPVHLSDLLAHGPVVVTFYRGHWCPYCNLTLHSLEKHLPEMKATGATLVAISPQTPDNTMTTREKDQLTFEVLSDTGNTVAKQFGIVYRMSDALQAQYEKMKLDLSAYNGNASYELPLPATFIIAPDGKIAYAFVNPDYSRRMDPKDIITVLESLKK